LFRAVEDESAAVEGARVVVEVLEAVVGALGVAEEEAVGDEVEDGGGGGDGAEGRFVGVGAEVGVGAFGEERMEELHFAFGTFEGGEDGDGLGEVLMEGGVGGGGFGFGEGIDGEELPGGGVEFGGAGGEKEIAAAGDVGAEGVAVGEEAILVIEEDGEGEEVEGGVGAEAEAAGGGGEEGFDGGPELLVELLEAGFEFDEGGGGVVVGEFGGAVVEALGEDGEPDLEVGLAGEGDPGGWAGGEEEEGAVARFAIGGVVGVADEVDEGAVGGEGGLDVLPGGGAGGSGGGVGGGLAFEGVEFGAEGGDAVLVGIGGGEEEEVEFLLGGAEFAEGGGGFAVGFLEKDIEEAALGCQQGVGDAAGVLAGGTGKGEEIDALEVVEALAFGAEADEAFEDLGGGGRGFGDLGPCRGGAGLEEGVEGEVGEGLDGALMVGAHVFQVGVAGLAEVGFGGGVVAEVLEGAGEVVAEGGEGEVVGAEGVFDGVEGFLEEGAGCGGFAFEEVEAAEDVEEAGEAELAGGVGGLLAGEVGDLLHDGAGLLRFAEAAGGEAELAEEGEGVGVVAAPGGFGMGEGLGEEVAGSGVIVQGVVVAGEVAEALGHQFVVFRVGGREALLEEFTRLLVAPFLEVVEAEVITAGGEPGFALFRGSGVADGDGGLEV